jgi:hypothetical protein
MKELPRLQALILQAATELGAEVETAPAEWTGAAMNAEVLRPISGAVPFQRDERDLPKTVGAALLDASPVLIGELPGEAHRGTVDEALRRYRNQATIARSWMGAMGPNLQLFLYGPVGALNDRRWRQLATSLEADDRICRKLVWLFYEDPNLAAAIQFLQRTFVARPWARETTQAQLDLMEVPLPAGWQSAIDNPDLDPEQLVRELVRLAGDEE